MINRYYYNIYQKIKESNVNKILITILLLIFILSIMFFYIRNISINQATINKSDTTDLPSITITLKNKNNITDEEIRNLENGEYHVLYNNNVYLFVFKPIKNNQYKPKVILIKNDTIDYMILNGKNDLL
jgi:uncharacterized membrane protein